ncbi:MAG: 16S rRNA processing protein RimM [Ruminococcaceae bacterium]|nr:16S rRNA processing protein RimM [Oscillospiraceae bacterium]
MTKQYLESGKIINTHGINGEVKIEPWCDSPEFLKNFKRLYIDGVCYKVLKFRVQKNFVYILFEGIDDLDKAITMKNKVISIDRNDHKLPKGQYYIQDLIGLKAVSDTGEELGTVREIMDRPSYKIYVIQGEREILIPGVAEFVLNIDMDAGVIHFHLLEGM